MRGKVWKICLLLHMARITPAHAGKSHRHGFHQPDRTDHPRTCGEKLAGSNPPPPVGGSPPHMRGKAVQCAMGLYLLWITPAHAGKSFFCRLLYISCKDHPRTCGEKSIILEKSKSPIGSPPHMRGKVAAKRTQSRLGGITPAHAGKSDRSTGEPGRTQDHPRTCGEKLTSV